MKAIIHNTQTGTLTLQDLPTPFPDPDHGPSTTTHPSPTHLLHIHTVALTHNELTWAPTVHWPTLHIPGFDITGTILTSVPNSPFHPGDEVYGLIDFPRDGGAREYAEALPSELAPRPRGWGDEEAATVPMSAETAWQALFVHGGLEEPESEGSAKGKRVLVTAASGGVGVWAVQLAKMVGATVVGSCGTGNVEFVRGLGADEVVDYRTTGLEAYVGGEEERKFDVVIEATGMLEDAWKVVKKDGVLVSLTEDWFKLLNGGRPEGYEDVNGLFFIVKSDGEQLAKISKLVDSNNLRAVVDSVWPLENFQDAFDRTATGHARGKVVLTLPKKP